MEARTSPPDAAPGRASDPFVIVLGHVRSGTTMLRAMLDSHPQLAIPPESYFVMDLLERPGPVDIDRLRDALAADRYFGDWQLPIEALDELRDDPRVRTAADAVAGLYALYARRAGKPRYGDKTPSHLRWVDVLATRFPNARFLHIVRDGRDVAASVVTMEFGHTRFPEAARVWRRKVLKAHLAGMRLGPERYQEVRYEDLVADPVTELQRICTFLGLEYAESMLEYHVRADELLAGLRHTDHVQGIRRPPTVGVRDWHVDLSPHDIAVFDEVAGTALDALGYPRSGLRRSLAARAEAATIEARITLRRTRKRYARRAERLVERLEGRYRRARA
jgi:hypothetical protein